MVSKICIDCLEEKSVEKFKPRSKVCKKCSYIREKNKPGYLKFKNNKRKLAKIKNREKIKEQTCTVCCIEKDILCFNLGEKICKECLNPILAKRARDNRKKYKEKSENSNHVKICKSCSKELMINFFHYGNSVCKKCKYIKNNENIKKNYKEYREKRNKNYVKRLKNDICFKLHKNVSKVIVYGISKEKGIKNGSCLNYLPFNSWEQLKKHIESLFKPWMNWNNWGKYNAATWDDNDQSTWTWQIDHIVPHSDLPYDSMEHPNFKKCWALDNLRPYSAKQNVLDGVNRTRHKKSA